MSKNVLREKMWIEIASNTLLPHYDKCLIDEQNKSIKIFVFVLLYFVKMWVANMGANSPNKSKFFSSRINL